MYAVFVANKGSFRDFQGVLTSVFVTYFLSKHIPRLLHDNSTYDKVVRYFIK